MGNIKSTFRSKKSPNRIDSAGEPPKNSFPFATCPMNHPLVYLGVKRDNGWFCDGREFGRGCLSGIEEGLVSLNKNINRFRCELCDFDLCEKCVDCGQFGPPVSVDYADIDVYSRKCLRDGALDNSTKESTLGSELSSGWD